MDVPQSQNLRQDFISGLPQDVKSLIINKVDADSVFSFITTSTKNMSEEGFKIHVIKAIGAKFGVYNWDLYYTSLANVRRVFNLLFKPGNMYKISISQDILNEIKLPEERFPAIPGEFVKIYSDSAQSGALITPDGKVYLYGKVLLYFTYEGKYKRYEELVYEIPQGYKILEPPPGEKFIDVTISSKTLQGYTCVLLTNTGKCYAIGSNTEGILGNLTSDITELTQIFSHISGIKQFRTDGYTSLILTNTGKVYVMGSSYSTYSYFNISETKPMPSQDEAYSYPLEVLDISNARYVDVKSKRYTFVDNNGYVYQTYDVSDIQLLEKWGIHPKREKGIYKIPELKNIIQAHGESVYIFGVGSGKLNVFLDDQGSIYFIVTKSVIRHAGIVTELVKGPYKLPGFKNIVKIFVIGSNYGFVTMNGEAYISMGTYRSMEDFIHGLENPVPIYLPYNMKAKDITLYGDDINLLLQSQEY